MGREFHFDLIGGIAGDMFAAAILDAWPELADGAIEAARQAGLPVDWRIEITQQTNGGMAGTHLQVVPPGEEGARRATPTGTLKTIREMLLASPLPDSVSARAVEIFQILGEAEGEVHGCPVDQVHFHEIADWDSVADIVMAAHLIDRVAADGWRFSSVPSGSGQVDTAHGPMPVPAPATAALLRGLETHDDGRTGERVTPTGAAILKHLGGDQSARPAGKVRRIGAGLGSKTFPGMSNCARLLEIETDDRSAATDTVGVIEFEVDDQTPEDLSAGLDAIRRSEHVLDVLQTPGYGKKGRLVISVRVLCQSAALDDVSDLCLVQSSTIGLRYRVDHRRILPRGEQVIDGINVKVVERPGGGKTAKAEMDDIAANAGDRAGREALRKSIEALGAAPKPVDEPIDEPGR